MIKFIKGLFKLIEGILFILIPVVILYWTLTLVNLDIVKPFVAILSEYIDPLVAPFRSYIQYSVTYDNNFTINYTILFFAGVVLVIAFMFTLIGHILNFVDRIVDKMKLKLKEKEKLRKKQEEKQNFINEIQKNNTVYVILKLVRNQPTDSYLIKKEDSDFFSSGLVEAYENSLLNAYKKYSGKTYGNVGGINNLNSYIFTDINKFIAFLLFFKERVEEVNKGMQDLNIKFDYKIACHCSFSDASTSVDIEITSKILNLCNPRDILVSELLQNRLTLSENNNIKLYSRGIYLMNDKQIDVFKLKFD
ncbi:MAG: hypothetical protein WCG23_02995 [bacterium]